MISSILVDTSVFIDLFKGKDTQQTSILLELESNEKPYSIPMICAQEVLQGAKTKSDWKRLWAFFKSQDLVTTRDPLNFHYSSAKIYYDCRREGITIRSSIDCMIAQLALEYGASLLCSDKDYKNINKIRSKLRLL